MGRRTLLWPHLFIILLTMMHLFEKKKFDGIKKRPRVPYAEVLPYRDAAGAQTSLLHVESPDAKRPRPVVTKKEGDTFLSREKNIPPPESNQAIVMPVGNQHEETILSMPSLQELRQEIPVGHNARQFRFGILCGFVTVVALGAILSTVFTRLTVTIKPRVEAITIERLLASLDTSVSKILVAPKVIPAERFEFTRQTVGEFDATGSSFIEEKARGMVKLYNGFSSSPQRLVPETRFVTDSGILFRLPKAVIIPGAQIEEGKIISQFIEIELIADQAGDSSNIKNEQKLLIAGFKGSPKYEGFWAIASNGFTGGFRGQARVVTKDDINRAEEAVTRQVFEELKGEIDRKIPPEFRRIDGLREIQIVNVETPPLNIRRDKFSVTATAVGRTLVFRESDVMSLVRSLVFRNDPMKEYIEGSGLVEYQVGQVDFLRGTAGVFLQGAMKARAVIPNQEIVALVRGKKEGSLKEFLKNRKDVASFAVSFFPPWILKSPGESNKIKVIIDK